MTFSELVEKRKSVRGFLPKSVSREDIYAIADLARKAPSAANRQPWKLYAVLNSVVREKLCKAYPRDWLAEAPVILVFTGLNGKQWVRNDGADYLLCDVTILADHVVYAAEERGLGTCWIAAFDEQLVRDALQLPTDEIPLLMTPLGYASEKSSRPTERKNLETVLTVLE